MQVNEKVSRKYETKDKQRKQTPFFFSTLKGKIFLRPPTRVSQPRLQAVTDARENEICGLI